MKFVEIINRLLPRRLRGFLVHISVWAALFALMHSYGTMMGREFNILIIIPNLIYISLFYLNYSVLIERLLFKGRVWGYILTNVAIFTALFFVMDELGDFIDKRIDRVDPQRGEFGQSVFGHVFFSVLVIAPSLSIKMTAKWLDSREKIRESESMRVEMELSALKNQLNPHFLFNSLNSVYALISLNPSVAQSSLMSVCDLLRYQLYDSNYPQVALDKEIEFINNYCKLMRVRLGDSVNITVDLPQSTDGVRVAPLLFISLVENAFKHGVDADKQSYINIKMTLIGGIIRLTCTNSNYPKTSQDRSGSGIGLVNLQRRLELIYPHTHTYDVKVLDDSYIVTLIINTQHND